MTINVIGDVSGEQNAFTIIQNELFKIKEQDIKLILSDKVQSTDITYWLSIGNFNIYREKHQLGKKNLVLFNPYSGWEDISKHITHCVFQCRKYYNISSIPNKYLIPTGVDLDIFKPNIKIGVVAIYRENKGKGILTKLFARDDLENFSFHLCGKRWEMSFRNKIAREYPYCEMPKFYNSIDYLLIPTDPNSGEGGPMVMIEALACGKPVITTNVGYAEEFNVKIFNDINGLVEILKNIEKDILFKYRQQVLDYTWDNYRKKHIELFRNL